MTNINTSRAGENTAKVFGEIANGTDTLKKTSNVMIAIIDIAMSILGFFPGFEGVKAGFGLFSGRLKDTKSVISATALLGRGYEWADPKARKSITKTRDDDINRQKITSRVALTAAQVFETVGFVDSLGVGFFRQPALCIGGAVPIFDIVKCSLYVISSVFGLWVAALDLQFADRSIKAANAKKRKWERRSMELGGLDNFKFKKVVNRYVKKVKLETEKGKDKIKNKIAKYRNYINLLKTDATEEKHKDRVQAYQEARSDRFKEKYQGKLVGIGGSEDISSKIADLKNQIADKKVALKISDKAAKKDIRKEIKTAKNVLAELKTKSVKAKKLETYIKAIDEGQVKNLADHKIEVQKVSIHNSKNVHTKSWISIASEVGKIFMITVGMLIFGLSLVFPVLTLPAVGIVMLSCGLVSSSFGLAKNLYGSVFYNSNKQTLPEFKVSAAA